MSMNYGYEPQIYALLITPKIKAIIAILLKIIERSRLNVTAFESNKESIVIIIIKF